MSLDRYLAGLRRRHGTVPGFDPSGARTEARPLILLETPGRGMDSSVTVTLDAPTGTARNLSRWLAGAGIDRTDVLLWNVVPWLIHAPGARTRAPGGAEIEAGIAELPGLLARLPALLAVVLAGRTAARASDAVRAGVAAPVLEMAHPSPVHVNADPAIAVRCRETLGAAATLLRAGRGTAGNGNGGRSARRALTRDAGRPADMLRKSWPRAGDAARALEASPSVPVPTRRDG